MEEASDFAKEVSYGNSTLAFPAEEDSFKVMIDSLLEQSKRHLHGKRIIERVSQLLRISESNIKDYDPQMVSVGPYHHGKEELQRAEKVKPIIAEQFVSGSGKTLYEFYNAILPEVNALRSYYVQGSTNKYSDEEFATMMLLDGCLVWAIIECIASSDGMSQSYMDEIKCLGMHSYNCFLCDTLFLMENQLPFQVLQLLMSLKYEGDDGMSMMNAFLDFGAYGDTEPGREIKVDVGSLLAKQQPLHLLELRCLTFNGLVSQRNKRRSKSRAKHKMSEVFYFFRSVSELKAKGIYVRCNGSSLAASVKFKSFFFFGILELPMFLISPYRITRFSNLIAYELTLRDENMLCLTSFINLMKSLINSPEDVKELRSKHILVSEQYSSDEEVVNILNSVTTFPVENYYMYEEVKESIRKHYNSKAKTLIAELIHTYFSSPWTFIAFFAAIFALALTCIQTYFAIYPRSDS